MTKKSLHVPQSLFIIAFFGLISFGAISMNNENIFNRMNLVSSTMIGAALLLILTKSSRFSVIERYAIFSIPFFICRVEGNWFKPAVWLMHSLLTTTVLLLFTALSYVGIDLIFRKVFIGLNLTPGILMTAAVCCTTLVLLGYRSPKKVKPSKKLKICKLIHCLKLLSKPLNFEAHGKIINIIKSYDLGMNSHKQHIMNLTVNDAYEVVSLILDDASQTKTLDIISKWIIQCQTEGGFGLWPTSSPRLFSTYQAISILQDVNLLDKCNADLHISWIKTLQQPDGTFKSPWSEREAWQGTSYAVESLNTLGASLDPVKANLCKNWCNNILIDKGLESDRLDIVYYCFTALTALEKVDENISKLISDWLSSKIEELLLTNVSLDYKNVHFAIMIYDILDEHPNISSGSIKLLTERIQTALSAELADIRI